MKRLIQLGGALALVLAVIGCQTLQYTAGVCDCDPPPVVSLLVAPKLPAHLCPTPPVAPVAPVIILPKATDPPSTGKVIEGGK